MLEIQNVSKTFNAGTVNEKTALNGLNLKLNEGDFVTRWPVSGPWTRARSSLTASM